MDELTIQDLTDQTGVPRRTIHFYSQQGILPAPEGAGLGARYHPEHLVRLKLIPVLRARGLRLDEIRSLFQGSDPAALERLLLQETAPRPILPPQPVAQTAPPVPQPVPTLNYSLVSGIILVIPQEFQARQPDLVQRLIKACQDTLESDQEAK